MRKVESLVAVRESLALLSRRDKRLLGLASVLQSILSLADLAAILLLGIVSSQALLGAGESTTNLTISNLQVSLPRGISIGWLAVIAGLLLLTKSILSLIISRRVFTFIANRQAVIATDLATKLLSRPLADVQRRSSQETVFALSTGVLAATVGVLGAATIVAAEASLIVVLVAGLFFLNWAMALFALTFFGLLALFLQIALGRWAFVLGRKGRDAEVGTLSSLQQLLYAYRELTVSGRRKMFIERFTAYRWDAAKVQSDFFVLSQVSKYTFEVGLVLGAAILALFVVVFGNSEETIGIIVVFLLVAARIFPSLLRVQGALSAIRNSAGLAHSTYSLDHELSATPAPSSHSLALSAADVRNCDDEMDSSNFVPDVNVSDLRLEYAGASQPALDGIDLFIPAGTSLAIVGPSGAGKTSLVDVMLGVMEPTSGSVAISGEKPLEAIRRWRGLISYVPQNVTLIDGTVRENVALGWQRDEFDDAAIWEALENVQMREFFERERAGLDSYIGENGVRLSGGQGQRVGLARALFSRPKLIVLDEATSALDAETELAISSTLADLAGHATVVVVAHRLSTVRRSHAVIFLQDGKVRGSGTFSSLREEVPDFDRQAELMGL